MYFYSPVTHHRRLQSPSGLWVALYHGTVTPRRSCEWRSEWFIRLLQKYRIRWNSKQWVETFVGQTLSQTKIYLTNLFPRDFSNIPSTLGLLSFRRYCKSVFFTTHVSGTTSLLEQYTDVVYLWFLLLWTILAFPPVSILLCPVTSRTKIR